MVIKGSTLLIYSRSHHLWRPQHFTLVPPSPTGRQGKNEGVGSQIWRWHTSLPPIFYCHMDCMSTKGRQKNRVYLWGQEERELMGLGFGACSLSAQSRRLLGGSNTWDHWGCTSWWSPLSFRLEITSEAISITVSKFSAAQSWVLGNCLDNTWWLIINGI